MADPKEIVWPPVPIPQQPLVDPDTGLINPSWHRWFVSMREAQTATATDHEDRIAALEP